MTLYVVRHGEATWNVLNKICGGRSDVPLTDKGRAQARALAKEMPHVDRVYCSPLMRAQETAALLMEGREIEIVTEPRLKEQDFGIYEGLDRGTPEFLAAKKEPACHFPDGESSFGTAARVYSLLEQLKAEQSDDTVLLVCHGGVCRLIRTYFEDMTNEEFFHYSEENGAIREYRL